MEIGEMILVVGIIVSIFYFKSNIVKNFIDKYLFEKKEQEPKV